MYFFKETKFPIKGETERRKKAGRKKEEVREEERESEILLSKLPQMTFLGAAVQVSVVGRFPVGAQTLDWLCSCPPLPSQLTASQSMEHTPVCRFWFHLISILPAGWWPWSPLGNLHSGSHGYLRLPDRRLLRADGRRLRARIRLRAYLSYPASCILLFILSPTCCVCVHRHTHTHLSLDPAWSDLDKELMMFQIFQVPQQQRLTFIEHLLSAKPMKWLAY